MCTNTTYVSEKEYTELLCSVVDSNVVAGILCRLDNTAEDRSPPGPGGVKDHIIRVGDEWSVVCVELARLVRRTVVVRVTDR